MIIYLYKKTHRITGLKYLGKTTSKDPYNYSGSGTYWRRHLNLHGHCFETEILKECTTKDELKYWGEYYSKLWNIVESDEWANLKPESGDGGPLAPESIEKMREKLIGRKRTPEQNERKSQRQKGKKKSASWVEKRSGKNHYFYGKKRPDFAEKYKGDAHWNKGRKLPRSEEHAEKFRGNNNPMCKPEHQRTCPHCEKSMNKVLFKRWHGDNCKLKLG
jgi:hypothetical protein